MEITIGRGEASFEARRVDAPEESRPGDLSKKQSKTLSDLGVRVHRAELGIEEVTNSVTVPTASRGGVLGVEENATGIANGEAKNVGV